MLTSFFITDIPISGENRATAFPAKLLAISMILTIIAMVWMGGINFYIHDFLTSSIEENMLVDGLADSILYEDSILTGAVKRAAATGDPQWEKLYNEHTDILDAHIKTTLKNFSYKEVQEAAGIVGGANKQLAGLERKSLELVRLGKLREADEIIDSEEYEKYRQNYVEDLRDFAKQMRASSHQPLLDLAHNVYYTLYLVLLVVVVLFIAWYFAIRSMRRWRKKLNLAQKMAEREAETAYHPTQFLNSHNFGILVR